MEHTEKKHQEIIQLFEKHFNEGVTEKTHLSSDGSDRKIIRLRSHTGNSSIGIINENPWENRAFISFSEHFGKFGLNVPQIYGVSRDKKCYLMQDLGDSTLLNKVTERQNKGFGKTEIELYKRVIVELVRFQIEAGGTIDYSLCYQHAEFGRENMEQDLNYFQKRFLHYFYGSRLDENRIKDNFNIIIHEALKVAPVYFLYRDFQSRNIMLKDGELYFIDYQSGRKGALQYDLASLLYDAKANVPQDVREELIGYYISQAKKFITVDETEFRNRFWYFAVIRILQAMGAYGYLGIVKGKKKFLESIPYALVNIGIILNEKLSDTKLDYLREIFKSIKYEA